MPAYNAENFIAEAIDSILAQTYADFELIILDDGSTDSTADIVQGYTDDRVFLVRKKNEGVAMSLNRGIELAKGEFIWRHDADDISLPEKLEKEVSFLEENPTCLLVATQIAFMTERGLVAKAKRQPKQSWFRDQPFKWVAFEDFSPFSPITHGTVLIRASAFVKAGHYRTDFITSEDIDMWLRMMEHGKLAVLNECLSFHRISATSATAIHGWKNDFYRELAKTFWKQRQEGQPDNLEAYGSIIEPEAPKPEEPTPPTNGRTFRSDLLNFHYAIHINAGDWREVAHIIRYALADGWRLSSVYRAILIPLLPNCIVKFLVRVKGTFR